MLFARSSFAQIASIFIKGSLLLEKCNVTSVWIMTQVEEFKNGCWEWVILNLVWEDCSRKAGCEISGNITFLLVGSGEQFDVQNEMMFKSPT